MIVNCHFVIFVSGIMRGESDGEARTPGVNLPGVHKIVAHILVYFIFYIYLCIDF